MKIPEISSVSIASEMPGQGLTANGYKLEGQDNFNVINVIYTDQSFLDCFGLVLTDGRNFYDNPENDKFSFFINQSLHSFAGWEDPLNKKIIRNGEHVVIGVVKDFHFASLESPIQPLIISCNPRNDSWDY